MPATLADLRCDCGCSELFSVSPGHDRIGAVLEEARIAKETKLVRIPSMPDFPIKALCEPCWLRAYKSDLFAGMQS